MNKQHFKEACLRYGMPAIPAFRLEDEDIPFPVIVKPVDNGGSFGVTVCHNRAEMEEAIVKAIQYSTVGDYLCEKFIEGNYFKIEVWKQNGRTYFPYAKSRVFYDAVGNSPRQPFIDLYPSFDSRSLKSLHTPLTSMLNSLEVTDGSCWFEGLVCNGIPYIFDTGFRLSGGMDFRVVREDKGIDLIACHMQYALTGHFGEDFFALNSPLHHCYATICIGLRNGVISHIRGIEAQPVAYLLVGILSVSYVAVIREPLHSAAECRSIGQHGIMDSAVVIKDKIGHYASISLIRFIISIAPSAHSLPLLPAFEPARSIACSIFSVVITPNITGIPLSSEVCAMPFAASLQTRS